MVGRRSSTGCYAVERVLCKAQGSLLSRAAPTPGQSRKRRPGFPDHLIMQGRMACHALLPRISNMAGDKPMLDYATPRRQPGRRPAGDVITTILMAIVGVVILFFYVICIYALVR